MEAKLKVNLLEHTPNPDAVVAKAAKLCYSKIGIDDMNVSDEEVFKFVRRLASMGHFSPVEHVSFTFAIEGVSRACYDKDTEVLTSNGWKLFKDISPEEIVATLNLESNKVEFNKINEKIEYQYNGIMHKYKSQNIDLLVTPNHNMVAKKFDTRTTSKLSLVPSEEMNLKRYNMTKAFDYTPSKIDENITIPGYEYQRKNNNGEYRTVLVPDLVLNRVLFYKFLAWYISDGSTVYSSNENKYIISITQTECIENIQNNTISDIIDIISELGFSVRYDGNNIRFNSLCLGRYLKDLGTSSEKSLPINIFKSFDRNLSKIFINEYLRGDGHVDKNSCGKLYTSSKSLANQLQIICFIAGYSAIINEFDRRGHHMICGKNVNVNHISYTVNISMSGRRNINPLIKTDKHRSNECYDGYVYCVNVENHTLFVRRNGIAIWCGNCTHQLVRHRIASFSQQSQRYVKLNQFEYVIPPKIKNNDKAKSLYIKQMHSAQKTYDDIYDTLLIEEAQNNGVFKLYQEYVQKQLLDIYKVKGVVSKYDWEQVEPYEQVKSLDAWWASYDKTLDRKDRKYSSIQKMIIEDARFVFPNACETKICVTMNARSLMNFFHHRCCDRAQWEIRGLAEEMYKSASKVAPAIFFKAGPNCVSGPCPEGVMSCGKVVEMREKYKIEEM